MLQILYKCWGLPRLFRATIQKCSQIATDIRYADLRQVYCNVNSGSPNKLDVLLLDVLMFSKDSVL